MATRSSEIESFQKTVWDYYQKNKRDFPWRKTRDPYKILVSEIMLQQTQAPRVVEYYKKWLVRFPNITSLAGAAFQEIYPFWQGLGYNRRALSLQKAAKKAVDEYDGKLPTDVGRLEEFPGIGPYTARAVSIFSFNTPVACIETNIRRVFIHHFFFDRRSLGEGGSQAKLVTDEEILKIAELTLDKEHSREWHWALMDYGSHLRSTLSLSKGGNPNRRHKDYSVQQKFEGSLRQIRGTALKILSAGPMDKKELTERLEKITSQDLERIKKVMGALEKERLIKCNEELYSLN